MQSVIITPYAPSNRSLSFSLFELNTGSGETEMIAGLLDFRVPTFSRALVEPMAL